MTRRRDLDQMLAAISEEETLEAQLDEAQEKGAPDAEVRRLSGLLNVALRREVAAEGEVDE